MDGPARPHPWPPHLAWVIAPSPGPQAELAHADDDVTCLYQWPSGTRLAEYLPTHFAELAPCCNRRVADIGCGRGVLGLTAYATGAASVLFADASPVAVEFLARTIALNALAPRAHVVQHHWGTTLPGEPYDVILGGDILYRPECFADLMSTIARSLSVNGCALLSDPRSTLEPQLAELAAMHRLKWTARRIEHTTVIHLVGCTLMVNLINFRPGVVPQVKSPITPPMPEKPATYANFPEREQKVVIGPNINAVSTKALRRMSIGTYEMSFVQQERGKNTADAARTALNHVAKALGLTVTPETHRDFVYTASAANAEIKLQVWVTTPFELTQSAHIIWAKFQELTGEQKIGVAFKLNTGYTFEDIENVLKAAQKNAIVLPAGEPFVLKGNPPPRFAKKAVAPVAEDAAAATEPAAADEQPAEG